MGNLAYQHESHDYERSEKLTAMIMRLFEFWHLTYKEQAKLLSLSTGTKSTIARYKKGLSTLSPDRDTQDRIRFLLAIHKHLRTIFPRNKELAYQWPKSPNRYFLEKTPIEVISEEGFLGLVKVHNYLSQYMAG